MLNNKLTHEQKLTRQMNIQTMEALLNQKKYQEAIDFVDGLFGWKPGEIERDNDFTLEEIAEWCMTQI